MFTLFQTATKALSPLHFLGDVIPFTPIHGFTTESLFDSLREEDALLTMAYYCGCLSFKYPKDEDEDGDVLMAPNDDMRNLFMDTVFQHLPCEYQKAVLVEWNEKNSRKQREIALKNAYNDYIAGIQPKVL
jgi:hypothetical protein